jgi:FixJ family two-component response regulator
MNAAGVVYVVDDDPSFRTAVIRMLTAAGLSVQSFASGTELLAHLTSDTATQGSGCV